MKTLNRRAMLKGGLTAGMFGLTTLGLEAKVDPATGFDFEDAARAPKTAADYKSVALHLRTLTRRAEEDAKEFERVAKIYRKGIPGANTAQATDAARGMEHVAEHYRDLNEALEHLTEAYEGLADNFGKA